MKGQAMYKIDRNSIAQSQFMSEVCDASLLVT